MKYLITTVVLFCATVANSQNNSVGFAVSPGIAYRIYSSKQSNIAEPNEMPKLGCTFTASFEHKIHPKASVFSGLSFISNGFQSQEIDVLYSANPPSPATNYKSVRYRYSFYQIGIPLGINYFIPVKNIKLFFSAGVSANYLVNVRYANIIYLTDGNKRVSKRDDDEKYYKDFNFSAFASFGIDAKIAPKYSLRVFPNVSYNFTNVMNNNVYYKTFLDAANLGVGIYRQL